MTLKTLVATAAVLWATGHAMAETTLTIGTVNNNDILTMQKLSNPDNSSWVGERGLKP